MNGTEPLVPVPRISPAGFTIFSSILAAEQPARALYDEVAASRIKVEDLPEMIADIWTRVYDAPASDISEMQWVEIFHATGFFSYPSLAVRLPDGTRTPVERPKRAVILYRGTTRDRVRRMSWSFERARAEQLGVRHTPYGPAGIYQAKVEPQMILAYLGQRARTEGWTIVVDPAGLTDVERLGDIRGPQAPATY